MEAVAVDDLNVVHGYNEGYSDWNLWDTCCSVILH